VLLVSGLFHQYFSMCFGVVSFAKHRLASWRHSYRVWLRSGLILSYSCNNCSAMDGLGTWFLPVMAGSHSDVCVGEPGEQPPTFSRPGKEIEPCCRFLPGVCHLSLRLWSCFSPRPVSAASQYISRDRGKSLFPRINQVISLSHVMPYTHDLTSLGTSNALKVSPCQPGKSVVLTGRAMEKSLLYCTPAEAWRS